LIISKRFQNAETFQDLSIYQFI